jgi:outer membrane protein TolC
MSKLLKLLTLFTPIVSFSAYSAPFILSEKSLNDLALKGAPGIEQIEAAFLNASVREGESNQRFAPELFGRASYAETNERAIIQFQPIFSPIKQAQLGVRKNFKAGVDTSLYVVSDQRSAQSPVLGKIQNATTTTLAFTAQIDLWKNLLGRMTKTEWETANLEKKRAEIEKDIQVKAFRISLRRVFWALVANNESTKISEELLKTAQKQLEQSKLRFKNSVAEADEVARYQAQLSSREGTLLFLQYQKETLLKQLRNLLPELAEKEIELADYDLAGTFNEVLTCTATISQEKAAPYKYTHYDEAVSLFKEIKSNLAKMNSRYSDIDVKLFGTVRSTGVASDAVANQYIRGNYGNTIKDQTEQNRTGYEVGLNFNLPLGSIKENTKKVKELYDEKRLSASIQSTDAQVISTHQELSKSIKLLMEVIKAQKNSSEQLQLRLNLVRKKYEQARVGVEELVFDQDALLNSQLMTIETQLQILNTLFDYLVIYTETPCSFNRI